MNLNALSQIPPLVLLVLYFWSILWKGIALWRAANLKQRNWFIGVLLLNTMGILEIAYLFFFAKKKLTLKELKFWESK
jgi:Family of unknown function (DUF5652)